MQCARSWGQWHPLAQDDDEVGEDVADVVQSDSEESDFLGGIENPLYSGLMPRDPEERLRFINSEINRVFNMRH